MMIFLSARPCWSNSRPHIAIISGDPNAASRRGLLRDGPVEALSYP